MDYLVVAQAAAEIGTTPRRLANFLYRRNWSKTDAPVIAGRRLIRRDLLPALAAELNEIDSRARRAPRGGAR
jgi:hypothetical protein